MTRVRKKKNNQISNNEISWRRRLKRITETAVTTLRITKSMPIN